jgi:hypothetical protein
VERGGEPICFRITVFTHRAEGWDGMDGPLLGFQAPQTDLAIIQGRFVCKRMEEVNREVVWP